MKGEDSSVTVLLERWQSGEQSALERLMPLVHEDLSRLASRYMRGEQQGHTLQTSGLVNESFLRLAGANANINNREHFFSLAARLMRRVLVDHARARGSAKRGGELQRITFDEAAMVDQSHSAAMLDIDQALRQLAEHDPRMSEALELLYFGGLTYDEAARVLGVSRSQLGEEVRFAKAWLRAHLSGE